MSSCVLEEQANWVGELTCAWLIVNEPVKLFEPFKVSIPLVIIVWVLTWFCRHAWFRAACRSLSLAFALCFALFPVYIPIPFPAWPVLFLHDPGSQDQAIVWARFTLIYLLAHSLLWQWELWKAGKNRQRLIDEAREWWRPESYATDENSRRDTHGRKRV